jgi:hypothetical protein
MPAVTKEEALELLVNEMQQKLGAEELLEVYNEVFPDCPCTEEEAHENSSALMKRLVEHINSGLEVDEVIDLWGLILPKDRNVWYDDEAERIYYNEETEAVSFH